MWNFSKKLRFWFFHSQRLILFGRFFSTNSTFPSRVFLTMIIFSSKFKPNLSILRKSDPFFVAYKAHIFTIWPYFLTEKNEHLLKNTFAFQEHFFKSPGYCLPKGHLILLIGRYAFEHITHLSMNEIFCKCNTQTKLKVSKKENSRE